MNRKNGPETSHVYEIDQGVILNSQSVLPFTCRPLRISISIPMNDTDVTTPDPSYEVNQFPLCSQTNSPLIQYHILLQDNSRRHPS